MDALSYLLDSKTWNTKFFFWIFLHGKSTSNLVRSLAAFLAGWFFCFSGFRWRKFWRDFRVHEMSQFFWIEKKLTCWKDKRIDYFQNDSNFENLVVVDCMDKNGWCQCFILLWPGILDILKAAFSSKNVLFLSNFLQILLMNFQSFVYPPESSWRIQKLKHDISSHFFHWFKPETSVFFQNY